MIMLRWLLLGVLTVGLGLGFSNGWLEVQWLRLLQDAGIDVGDQDQPMRLHEHPFLKPPSKASPQGR